MPDAIPAAPGRAARAVAALIGAVDALAAVALPFGVLVVAALVAWAGFGASAPWFAFVRGAADVWLLGHAVDVRFAPPSGPS
ncbi:MAG: hypothetical protein QOE37_132, partial [Microbacteriaceae bacterium]|nr:hypothetical protein [Microbacteriaceae bacterium]